MSDEKRYTPRQADDDPMRWRYRNDKEYRVAYPVISATGFVMAEQGVVYGWRGRRTPPMPEWLGRHADTGLTTPVLLLQ